MFFVVSLINRRIIRHQILADLAIPRVHQSSLLKSTNRKVAFLTSAKLSSPYLYVWLPRRCTQKSLAISQRKSGVQSIKLHLRLIVNSGRTKRSYVKLTATDPAQRSYSNASSFCLLDSHTQLCLSIRP